MLSFLQVKTSTQCYVFECARACAHTRKGRGGEHQFFPSGKSRELELLQGVWFQSHCPFFTSVFESSEIVLHREVFLKHKTFSCLNFVNEFPWPHFTNGLLGSWAISFSPFCLRSLVWPWSAATWALYRCLR